MAADSKTKHKMPKEQMTPFKDLTLRQKIGHIFYYYKYYMLAAVIAAATAASLVYSYQQNNYDTVCSIAVINGKMSGQSENKDAITTGFTEYLGINGKSERVECDYHYTLNTQFSSPLDEEGNASIAKIYTLASTHSLDGIIMPRENITFFSTDIEPFFTDLRTILSEDELSAIEEHIVCYTMTDGTQIPIAVDLSGTKIKTQTDFTMQVPCYGVVVTAPNPDEAAAFIRYAFGL